MSKKSGLTMSHVRMLYLDWVDWATYCCKEFEIWTKTIMVGLKDAIVGIDTLDIQEKL